MPDYRLYLLNPHSGHIDGVEEFHTADDIEAVCIVQAREAEVPRELWCGGRKVSRFDARPEGPVPLTGAQRAHFEIAAARE